MPVFAYQLAKLGKFSNGLDHTVMRLCKEPPRTSAWAHLDRRFEEACAGSSRGSTRQPGDCADQGMMVWFQVVASPCIDPRGASLLFPVARGARVAISLRLG